LLGTLGTEMRSSQWKDGVLGVWTVSRDLSRDALRIFSERGVSMFCGSIAFYALVSAGPILVIGLSVAGLFVDPLAAGSTIHNEVERWVGVAGARTVLKLVSEARQPTASPIASLLGTFALVYASTRLFSQLMKALDLLWGAPPLTRPNGIRERVAEQLRKRGLAFAMVIGVGLMLVALVLFQVFLAWARQTVGTQIAVASRPVEALASFAVTVTLFFAMFRILSRASVTNGDAAVGGVVTAALFTLGSFLITAYVTLRDSSIYGAAGAIVMLMLWVHYNAHAFFLGASFAAAHARRREALAKSGRAMQAS
jgi:membrane protein